MRPGILDAARHLDRPALGELRGGGIDLVVGQFIADAGVEGGFWPAGLSEGEARRGGDGRKAGANTATVEHEEPP